MASVRQEPRIPVGSLVERLVERGQWCCDSARGGNTEQHGVYIGSIYNCSARAPGATAALSWNVFTNDERGTAGQFNLLEPALGEETDEAAIGGPERLNRPVRARERPGSQRIQIAHPQRSLTIHGGRKCDVQTVGRNGREALIDSISRFFRRQHEHLDNARRL